MHTNILTKCLRKNAVRLGLGLALASTSALAGPIPNPGFVARSAPTDRSVAGGEFENGSIDTFRYLTSSNGWTFGDSSGIVREGHAFAASHTLSANYGAFLQKSDSSMQRSFPLAAGAYQFKFLGAQRLRRGEYETQIIRVLADGNEVFDETLEGGPIRDYYTRPFFHSGGILTLRFEGRGDGDVTAVIDRIRLQPVRLFHQANSWQGGRVPSSLGNHVNIPASARMAFASGRTARAGHIHVEGELSVLDSGGGQTTTINCASILIDGPNAQFQAGLERSFFLDKVRIRLHGASRSFDIEGFGNKFIGARSGGLLSLHGRPVTNYRELSFTVRSGRNQITIPTALGWRVGDRVLITGTGAQNNNQGSAGWRQNEIRSITRIENLPNNRQRLTLDSNLSFRHTSESYTSERTIAPRKTWNYEVRARAALLDRQIVVEGDTPGANGFGGHIMIMGLPTAGVANIANVHLSEMGQKGMVGRYPFHWHLLANDGEGQYFNNCSIERSFNRAITIHATHRTLVRGNVAYDHLGHGLFLEDGAEEENIINNNLIVYSRKPAQGEEVIPSDNSHRTAQNETPSSFWIANPRNTMNGNIAASSEGVGFWFIFNDRPTGAAAADSRFNNIRPRISEVTSFKNNITHSSRLGFDVNDAVNPANLRVQTNQSWNPRTTQYLEGFKAWANNLGIYTGLGNRRNTFIFDENELIENEHATMFASYNDFHNGLIVAETDEDLNTRRPFAIRLYDGPAAFLNTHFVGFNVGNASLSLLGGGANARTNWLIEGASFNHSGAPNNRLSNTNAARDMDVIVDVDGNITGIPQGRIVTTHPIMRTPNDPAAPRNFSRSYVTLQDYGVMYLGFPGTPNPRIGGIRYTRRHSSEPNITQIGTHPSASRRIFLPILNNTEYEYDAEFIDRVPQGKRISVVLRDWMVGDSVVFSFRNLGTGLSASSARRVNSLSELRNASATSFFVSGRDITLKLVRVNPNLEGADNITVRWN